jgi:mRNA turnover protein 4
MPKSKRARVVSTSKTKKNRKELVQRLHANVQAACDGYDCIWVFDVQNMRNSCIKEVRSQLSDSRLVHSAQCTRHVDHPCRIFMGKTKLMLHALGSTPETAHLPGTHLLAPYMSGEIGLLFTSRSPPAIESYFAQYAVLDYARAGAVAPAGFVIARGELRTAYGVDGGENDLVPLAVEPTLRKLGVPTRVVRGRVVLEEVEDEDQEGYVVCRAGDVLDSRQTTLLKIFGVRMAEFKVLLRAMWEKSGGSVRVVGGMDVDGA